MRLRPYIGVLILLLIIVFPALAHLDDFPIQLWDEGRLACSALEMYESGDPIVVTFDGQPEMWSTKPPLLIWIQVIFLKVFGISDLAFRLPSALAAVSTCLLLFWHLGKKYSFPFWGACSAIILISSKGFVKLHGIRTGDYDSLLCLFTTAYIFCFFLFVQEGKRKYLNLTVSFIILACLTKGVAGILYVPMLMVYAIWKRKLLPMFRMKEFYLGIVAFLVLVIGYYLLREYYNPGYIAAVRNNELGGRYNEVLEGHDGGPMYYVIYLINDGFNAWYLLFVAGAVLGLAAKDRTIRDITAYLLLCIIGFLIIVSTGATKLEWYMVPLFPLLAVVSSVALHFIISFFQRPPLWERRLSVNVLPYLVIFLLSVGPYTLVMKDVMKAPLNPAEQKANDAGAFLQKILKDGYPYKQTMRIVLYEYQSGIQWYLKAFRLKGIPVTIADKYGIGNEELVLLYRDEEKSFLEQTYHNHVVQTHGFATLYQVHGRK